MHKPFLSGSTLGFLSWGGQTSSSAEHAILFIRTLLKHTNTPLSALRGNTPGSELEMSSFYRKIIFCFVQLYRVNSKIRNLFPFSHKPAVTQVDIVHWTFLPISVDLLRVESKDLEEKKNKRREAICDTIQECDCQWDGHSPVLLSAGFQSGRQEWRGRAGSPGLSCFWAGLHQPSWWVRPAPNCSFSLNQRENQTSSIVIIYSSVLWTS